MMAKMLVITGGLSLLTMGAFFSFFGTLWFIFGGFWGLLNFYFIKQLLYGILLENPKNFLKIACLALIKFPVLYTLGFGLLYFGLIYSPSDASWGLLAGFCVSLALSSQKWFWKALKFGEKNEAAV